MIKIKKYKEILSYIFWGGVTTLINLGGYFLLTRFFGVGYLPASIMAWITATTFSYLANKFLVFQKKSADSIEIVKENIIFYISRIVSCVVDISILYIFVGLLGFPDAIIKMLSNAVAVVLNYVFSKWIIFR